MRNRLYQSRGIGLFSTPVTQNDTVNALRRGVMDLGSVTASYALEAADITLQGPVLFCGRHSKALPLLLGLLRRENAPFVLVGTRRELEDSPLMRLEHRWVLDRIPSRLSEGNGVLMLTPDSQTDLELKESLSGWDSHIPILCLGNGLTADHSLLMQLGGCGRYLLLSESLHRSVKGTEYGRLTPTDLLSAMDGILVSAAGTSAKALTEVLPTYESQRITNTSDWSTHRSVPMWDFFGRHEGHGFRLSQSRTLETRPILTQEDLLHLQENNQILLYCPRRGRAWVARIIK